MNTRVSMGGFAAAAVLVGLRANPQDELGVSVARPDLRGVVVDTGGAPLEGASVLVYTAAPRRGTSPY